jgi:hypothetical protein
MELASQPNQTLFKTGIELTGFCHIFRNEELDSISHPIAENYGMLA